MSTNIFSGSGQGGFDEGWAEGVVGGDLGISVGVHGQVCHGIDLGLNVAAAAEATAELRLLIVGAGANVGVEASAGVRGAIVLEPNIFKRFGLTTRIEAAAQVAAQARLEVFLDAEYPAQIAETHLDGLALKLFLAFLQEIEIGGVISGRVAYSAMVCAWLQASGSLATDEDAGFVIGCGYNVGLEGGYGLGYFVNVGFENPRRFFRRAVDLILDEVVTSFHEQLPPGSEPAVELVRLLTPVALQGAYDIGQRSTTQGIQTPKQIIEPFLVTFAEELQRYLADKAADAAAILLAQLIEEASARLIGEEPTSGQIDQIEDALGTLRAALEDGTFDAEDVDKLLDFALIVAELADSEMVQRVNRPIAMLWSAIAIGTSLRSVGELIAEGQVSVAGVGVQGRARLHPMPPILSMPEAVFEEYLDLVPTFTGSDLTLDHAITYLIEAGIGPILAERAPELSELLERLSSATGVSPANVVVSGLKAMTGEAIPCTLLYKQLRDFVRGAMDDVLRDRVFAAFNEVSGGSDDARLYVDEVVKPSLQLMVSFVFGKLDAAVDGSVTIEIGFLSNLQGGLSAVLYKIFAKNLVVLEQIIATQVRAQTVTAFEALETTVRSDRTSVLLTTTLDHLDDTLESLGQFVPFVPSWSGLTDNQIEAIQTFIAELLNVAQEALGDQVFTDAQWSRRRENMESLLLSLDKHINWNAEDQLAELLGEIKSCAFVPDEEALWDLFRWHVEVLRDQSAILVRRVPGALTKLFIALSIPDMEAMGWAAEVFAKGRRAALAAARTVLMGIRRAIGHLEILINTAEENLERLVEGAAIHLRELGIDDIKPRLVKTGKKNLRVAGEAWGISDAVLDPMVDAFGNTLDTALDEINFVSDMLDPLIDSIGSESSIRGFLDEAVSSQSTGSYIVAGGPSPLIAGTVTKFYEELRDKIDAELGSVSELKITIPNPRNPLNPIKGLSGADFVEALMYAIEAISDHMAIDDLAERRLLVGYRKALKSTKEAEKTNAESQVILRTEEVDGSKDRDTTTVRISLPIPINPRIDRVWFYGSVVPLKVRIADAGKDWVKPDGRRIQILCNGNSLEFPIAAWSYDLDYEALSIDTILRLDKNMVQPGFNVLEVSVTNSATARVRETVAFLVDAAGPVPNEELKVDRRESNFSRSSNIHASADAETVALRWSGNDRIELKNWTVMDQADHAYEFTELSLRTNGLVRVHTGGNPSADTHSERHWGRNAAVWNNEGDTVIVLDEKRVLRAYLRT